MSMVKGEAQTDPTSGLSKRIYENMQSKLHALYPTAIGATFTAQQRPFFAALAEAVAEAVVDEITANARATGGTVSGGTTSGNTVTGATISSGASVS